jgi:hypothetical protein
MTRQLQDPDLPARFPLELAAARDEHGEGMAYVRCNDGTIWLDTGWNEASGNGRMPWRRLPAIPEPTAEEVEAAERARQAALEEGIRESMQLVQEDLQAERERRRKERREVVLGESLERIQRREMEVTERAIAWYLRPFRPT